MSERISPGIELHARPFAKAVPAVVPVDELNKDAFYPLYPHLFLSTMLHSYVQGNPNANTRTMDFLRENGLASPITAAFEQAAGTIRTEFQHRTGVPYDRVTWLNEVPFCTTPNQVRIIDALCNPEHASEQVRAQLQERAMHNGSPDILELTKKLLRNPQQKVVIRGVPYTQKELLGFYRTLMKSTLKDTDEEVYYANDTEDSTSEPPSFVQKLYRQSADRQFAVLLASLLSYYYFPFEGTAFAADLATKRKIGIFNARTDQIGFLPLRDAEKNQQIIDEAVPAFAHHLNNKCMLPAEHVTALSNLITAVQNGDIAFYLHEVKTEMFHTRTVVGRDGAQTRVATSFAPKSVEPKHLRDVSHSITAMFFALQNVLMHPSSRQDMRGGFAELMSDDYQTRSQAFLTLMHRFRHFFHAPSKAILTKIYYPVIDVAEPGEDGQPNEAPVRTINPALVASVTPITSSLVLPEQDLYRMAVKHAYTVFKEVQENGKLRETPLDDILT